MEAPLREYVYRWLALGGRPVSPHWQRTRRSLLRHLIDAAGEIPLVEFGPAAVWRVQELCRKRKLSVETTNKVTHHVLPAMLRDLEEAGEIPPGTHAAAMRGVRRLRAASERPGRALSVAERDRLLVAFRGHWAAALVAFLLFTGVRVGEAAGLQQRDVDWSRRSVKIQRSRRGEEISAAKSRRAQRVIQLSHAATAAIAPLRDDDPEAWVFRSQDGAPLNVDNFRRRDWTPIVRRARIGAFRIHDCRHTFITQSLEAGVPVAKVAAYVGDKVQTVQEHYAHVIAADDWDAAVSAPPALRRVV